MYDKTKIYNLALSALLLQNKITNADTDISKEKKVFDTHWEIALNSTLEELDLNCTATTTTLALLEESPNTIWSFAYKYPVNCAFLRRIVSSVKRDDKSSRIKLATGIHNGKKVIFTNQSNATIEFIPNDAPFESFNSNAAMCLAYKLAWLSVPLIAGAKNITTMRKALMDHFQYFKTEAQRHDAMENLDFQSDEELSEFVRERLS